MEFNLDYFHDEVREGFFIPGIIKRSWAVQMNVLDEVRQICKRHNLKWFADYGTLIGAARHRGFIPWDDDLDICMLREDAEAFVRYAKTELPEGYVLLDISNNEEYNNFLVRVSNSSSIDFSDKFLNNNCGLPYSIGIDIFPLDYLYNDDTVEEKHRLRAKALMELGDEFQTSTPNYGEVLARAEEIAGFKLERDIPIGAAIRRAIVKIYKEAPKQNATHLACYYYWAKNKKKRYPCWYFDKITTLPFENTEINVVIPYDEMLGNVYGKWELAVKTGGAHEYPFFADQEQTLLNHIGELPYQYNYDPADLRRVNDSTATDPRENYYTILCKANGILRKVCVNKAWNSMGEVLEQCQNVAIALGNAIENRYGMGTISVSKLEEYCEALYEISQCSFEEGSLLEFMDILDTLIESSYEAFTVLKKKKLAVFVPFSAKYWKSMQYYYTELKNEGWDIIVMPTPFFDKDFNGNNISEQFDLSLYPAELQVTNYKEFIFDNFYAEKIVIQNPYDDKNGAITVLPFFYADNLRNFTDDLVYIPYLHIDDFDESDFKSKINRKWYVLTPGVVKANHILLDSERMRDNYIELLVQIAGEQTRNIWEEKIIYYPMQREESSNQLKKCSEKKIILFYTAFSRLYVQKEKMIEKIARIIDSFEEESSMVEVYWKTDKNLSKLLAENVPDISDKYLALVKRFNDLQLGTYDENGEVPEVVSTCDAYYGDSGYYMNICILRRIAVMKMGLEV